MCVQGNNLCLEHGECAQETTHMQRSLQYNTKKQNDWHQQVILVVVDKEELLIGLT